MCADWKDKFDPKPILDRIRDLRDLSSDSEAEDSASLAASDRMHSLSEYESLLLTAIRFIKEVPDEQKSNLLRKAIHSALSEHKLTPDSLIEELYELEREHLTRQPKKYALVGTLSITYDDDLTHRDIKGVRVTFNNRGKKEYEDSDAWGVRLKSEDDLIPHAHGRDYTNFRAFVEGRSDREAFDKAVTAVDHLRAVWNLHFNLKRTARWSLGGQYDPVNQVIYGPRFVLRQSQRIWREKEALPPVKPVDMEDEYEELRTFEQQIRGTLRDHPYRKCLDSLLLRYVETLDKRSMTSTQLGLWGLLESLTGSPNNHDTVADRALFLWPEDGIQHQMLKHLRRQRNQYVHKGARREDVETLVFLLKRYVERLILYHLYDGRDYDSLKESARFLDNPRNPEDLRRQIKQTEHTLRQKEYALKRRLEVSESHDEWRERIQAAKSRS